MAAAAVVDATFFLSWAMGWISGKILNNITKSTATQKGNLVGTGRLTNVVVANLLVLGYFTIGGADDILSVTAPATV